MGRYKKSWELYDLWNNICFGCPNKRLLEISQDIIEKEQSELLKNHRSIEIGIRV